MHAWQIVDKLVNKNAIELNIVYPLEISSKSLGTPHRAINIESTLPSMDEVPI
jgi:hypothetical protein